MQRVIIASNNKNKIYEFKKILNLENVEFLSLNDIGFHDEIDETGETFEENALIKAKEISKKFNAITISDDSGIEVEALNWAPGVHSKRFSETCDDNDNNKLLIKKLQGVENRCARYTCAICIYHPNGDYRIVKEHCYGLIVDDPIGDKGFGYDPHFYVEEYKTTLANVSVEEKNKISHRAKAIRGILSICDENLNFKR